MLNDIWLTLLQSIKWIRYLLSISIKIIYILPRVKWVRSTWEEDGKQFWEIEMQAHLCKLQTEDA